MTPLAPPPPPMVPRLVEDVVPDDRDDPEIILNTTTVSFHSPASAGITQNHLLLFNAVCCVVAKITHGQYLHDFSFTVLSICFQYYYSVRIFAGQEPSGVWMGWVTPDYHQFDPNFDLTKVRNVTVTVGDDKGNIHDR